MKKYILLLIGSFILFNACKKDIEIEPEISILGSWKLSNPGASVKANPKKGFENVAGYITTTINSSLRENKPDEVIVSFNANTFTIAAIDKGVKKTPITGSYSLQGDKITLKMSSSMEVEMDCILTISKLTLTQTVLLNDIKVYINVFSQFLDSEMLGSLTVILDQLNSSTVKNAVESLTLTLDFDRK